MGSEMKGFLWSQGRDNTYTPENCFANHKRSAHKGIVDPRCNACRELQARVEQKAKVTNGI